MKLKYALLLIILLGITTVYAEKGINYQAVARNVAGQPLSNTDVALKFTIHTGSETGPVIYQEEHVTHSNQFGIITVIVGGGITTHGSFDSIDWSADKFLQVEYDPSGGHSYSDMGTTKMFGAAFSSYANTANTSINANHAGVADSAVIADYSLLAANALRADTSANALIATLALSANHSLSADVAMHADTAATTLMAISAQHAVNADNATMATTATNALTATHSQSADFAMRADTATTSTTAVTAQHAVSADNATTATNALTASHSQSADVALRADTATTTITALSAQHAVNADNATTATTAATALTATHSQSADVAMRADTATTATMAVTAQHAVSADNATTATTATTALTTSGISVLYAEDLALSSTTSTGLQDKVTLTLQPGTYLITFSAMVSSTHDDAVQYAFNSGTTVYSGHPKLRNGGEAITVSSTIKVTYAVATTVKIQFAKDQGGGGETAYIQNATIAALRTN